VSAQELFAAFVDAHAAGERPDVRDYLARAGAERERLGALLDRFLAVAPVEPASDEDAVVLRARVEDVTPLTAARTRLALRIDDVVERLREALGLPESLRARLRAAYQELEAEQLDPAGVDSRVWDALRAIVGLDARRVASGAPSIAAPPMYRRAAGIAPAAMGAAMSERTGGESDEVDVLFRGRPDQPTSW
jgi:hypothetical protein